MAIALKSIIGLQDLSVENQFEAVTTPTSSDTSSEQLPFHIIEKQVLSDRGLETAANSIKFRF